MIPGYLYMPSVPLLDDMTLVLILNTASIVLRYKFSISDLASPLFCIAYLSIAVILIFPTILSFISMGFFLMCIHVVFKHFVYTFFLYLNT